MNYRHHFHAGNFADVMKHVALVAVLTRLTEKPRPLFLLETHASRGRYDLGSGAGIDCFIELIGGEDGVAKRAVEVALTFEQGQLSINGKASVNAIVGSVSGNVRGNSVFPATKLATKKFSFRCDIDTCGEFVTRGVGPLIDTINREFLAKLPARITQNVTVPVLQSVEATASVPSWPRLNDPRIERGKVVVTSDKWGPARLAIDATPIGVAVSAKFNGLRVELPCALGEKRNEPPVKVPEKEKTDKEVTPPSEPVCGDMTRLQVQFDTDKKRIDPAYKDNREQLRILDTVAKGIKVGCNVVLTGHAECNEGERDLNKQKRLAFGRANAVRQMLGDDAGPHVAIRMKSVPDGACKNGPQNRFVEIATFENTAAQKTGQVEGYVVGGATAYHCSEPQSDNAECKHYAGCTPITIRPEIATDTKVLEGLAGQTVNWVRVDVPAGTPTVGENSGRPGVKKWMPLFDVLPGPVSGCRR